MRAASGVELTERGHTSACQVRKFKKHYRRVQQLKRSTAKDEATRQARQEEIKEAHRAQAVICGAFGLPKCYVIPSSRAG